MKREFVLPFSPQLCSQPKSYAVSGKKTTGYCSSSLLLLDSVCRLP
ncbi:hypothetical protein MUK42_37617 [Musa troglodytarum]|uniref:Uncharacterized protein n=1 Tax=Musa troglodytarum TaxID=320322 RepID=A0A9E7GJP9_9LILI|nr:hypothetical protein MUK42_37617 [Musa troglodytarum]